MAEYIEREAAYNVLSKYYHHSTELQHEALREAINRVPAADVLPIPDGGIGEVSDGYHTFNGLYYQRMVLFATLVKQNKDKSWKSLRHEDGELCFGGGWFIVGIDTPSGSYTYHYEDNFWSMFDCQELPVAKHWDGHTEKDVTRLLSLADVQPVKWIPVTERLPDFEGMCLCMRKSYSKAKFRHQEIMYFDYDEQAFCSNADGVFVADGNVTHWMHLPKPPKDGEA